MVLCEKSNTFNVFHLTLSAKMASFKSLFSVLYKNPPIKKSRNSPVFSEKRSQDGKVRPGIGISSYSTSGQILYQRENRLPTSLGTALSTRAAVADFSPPQILTHFGEKQRSVRNAIRARRGSDCVRVGISMELVLFF